LWLETLENRIAPASSNILSLFELGNGSPTGTGSADIVGSPSQAGPDWADIFDAMGKVISLQGGVDAVFKADPLAVGGGLDPSTYSGAGGSNKNNDPITPFPGGDVWHQAPGNVPAKDDLSNVYAWFTIDPSNSHLIAYFGIERIDPNGDSHIDIELLQSNVAPSATNDEWTADPDNDGTTLHGRTPGDIIISMDFKVGGTLGSVSVHRWDGVAYSYVLTETLGGEGLTADGAIGAFDNGGSIDGGPWPNFDNHGDVITNLPKNAFTEVGVDLTEVLGFSPCLATYIAKTRSSASFTAELKDFARADLNICPTASSGGNNGFSKVNDPFVYEINLQNTGPQTLYLQNVIGTVLGNIVVNGVVQTPDGTIITAIDVPSLSLATGASETIKVTRVTQAADPDPFTDTDTIDLNTSPMFDGIGLTVQATHDIDLFAPAVQITKTFDEIASTAGRTIHYHFTITNLTDTDTSTPGLQQVVGGAPDLILESITDDVLGDLSSFATAAGLDDLTLTESGSFEVDYDVPTTTAIGLLTNKVDVLYRPQNFPNPVTSSATASVTIVDAKIEISPLAAANQVGADHDLTVTVMTAGGNIATGGAEVTASISGVGSITSPNPSDTNGAGTMTGTTTVTITSLVTGLSTVDATASIGIDVDGDGVADITLTRSTDGTTPFTLTNSDDADKRWVDARLSLTPEQAANQVGTTHTLTACLEIDYGAGAGFVAAGAGETINFTIVSDTASSALGAPSGTTGADGCTTDTLTSDATGLTTVMASWDGSIVTAEGTASASADSNDALKRWVDARLSLTPEQAANQVGTTHTLTACLEIDYGAGAGFVATGAGETIDVTIESGPGTLGAPSGTTGADGCTTDTLTSDDTGVTVVSASWSGSIGTAEGTASASTDSNDATKYWVDAKIQISPQTATNPINTNHDLTVTVMVVGGNLATGGAPVDAAITSGPGSFVGPDSGNTNGAGTTTGSVGFTITSSVAGTTLISASSDIPIDVDGDGTADVTVHRETDGSTTPSGLVNDDEAEKIWTGLQGKITPTGTTCEQFHDGTAQDLTTVNYKVRAGKISQADPGVFFYYTSVTVTAGQTVLIDQTASQSAYIFPVQQAPATSQVIVYDNNCVKLNPQPTITILHSPTFDGVQITGLSAGTFIISVKYSANGVVGRTAPNPTTVHYDFKTYVAGVQVDQDPDGLNLVKKAGPSPLLSTAGGALDQRCGARGGVRGIAERHRFSVGHRPRRANRRSCPVTRGRAVPGCPLAALLRNPGTGDPDCDGACVRTHVRSC
jgi:hypothetical protein